MASTLPFSALRWSETDLAFLERHGLGKGSKAWREGASANSLGRAKPVVHKSKKKVAA